MRLSAELRQLGGISVTSRQPQAYAWGLNARDHCEPKARSQFQAEKKH